MLEWVYSREQSRAMITRLSVAGWFIELSEHSFGTKSQRPDLLQRAAVSRVGTRPSSISIATDRLTRSTVRPHCACINPDLDCALTSPHPINL